MYHGTPAERAQLRSTVMNPDSLGSGDEKTTTKGNTTKGNSRLTAKSQRSKAGRRSGRFKKAAVQEEEVNAKDESADGSEKPNEDEGVTISTFPVVITTYEIIIKDRVHLANYDWGYIVVDEGHRLKNLDCKLMKEIKKYSSAGRMILTGTPLHVMSFSFLFSYRILIHIGSSRITSLNCGRSSISSCPTFSTTLTRSKNGMRFAFFFCLGVQLTYTTLARFNLPTMQANIGSERSSKIINALHAILKPFLLRRLKVDVETNLPPKKEYVLYAPLTVRQRDAYDKVLEGSLRQYLIGSRPAKPATSAADPEAPMQLRSEGKKRPRRSYVEDDDDDEHFDKLESGKLEVPRREENEDILEMAREHQYKATGE